jgi:hypothetical protein
VQTEKKLEMLKTQSAVAKARIEMMLARSRFGLRLKEHDLKGAIEAAERMEALSALHGSNIELQTRLVHAYTIATTHFLLGDAETALQKLLPVLTINESIRPDVQMWARMLLLTIHYELGNIDLLPYLWRSTYRALHKRNALHRIEKIMLTFLRRLIDTSSDAEMRTAFRNLNNDVAALRDDPFEWEIITTYGLDTWLRRKLNQKGSLLPKPKTSPRAYRTGYSSTRSAMPEHSSPT